MWVVLAFLGASFYAAMVLTQEKLKIESFAFSIWCKVACIIVTLPLVFIYGLPTHPLFYVFLFVQALMFAINDVIMFKVIPEVGGGVVSRIMPVTIFLSFIGWFLIDPTLISTYLQQPLISCFILAVLLFTVYFAMRLKKCAVSMSVIKKLWFVILAGTLGPIVTKLVVSHADGHSGPIGFTFVEAWMMIALWLLYILLRKPISFSSLRQKDAIKGGVIAGFFMAGFVIFSTSAVNLVDNPGYVTAIITLNAVIISIIHKILGRDDQSDKVAGLGLVGCAFILVLLKSQF